MSSIDDGRFQRPVIWCPLCSSVELRNMIVVKAKKHGINLHSICKDLNIRYSVFKKYWYKSLEPGSVKGFRAKELKKLAEIIGVKIKIVIADGMVDIDKIKPYIYKEAPKRRYVTIDRR